MEKRMILAPISANKWQEPCLNLAAILDILVFFCNIRMSAGQKCGFFLGLNFCLILCDWLELIT